MSLTRGSGPLGGKAAQSNYTIDAPAHRLLFEPDARRLRAFVGDTLVLDTRRAHLLHETGIPPVVYAPLEDFDETLLQRTDRTSHCPFKGDASYWSLRVGDELREDARCASSAGELIAQSTHPTLVFETSMPVRAYLPRGDVKAGHLRPSEKTSTDPYMGDAIYWHVHAGGELLLDAAHSYELPRAEAMKIASLVCYSGEGVQVQLDA